MGRPRQLAHQSALVLVFLGGCVKEKHNLYTSLMDNVVANLGFVQRSLEKANESFDNPSSVSLDSRIETLRKRLENRKSTTVSYLPLFNLFLVSQNQCDSYSKPCFLCVSDLDV